MLHDPDDDDEKDRFGEQYPDESGDRARRLHVLVDLRVPHVMPLIGGGPRLHVRQRFREDARDGNGVHEVAGERDGQQAHHHAQGSSRPQPEGADTKRRRERRQGYQQRHHHDVEKDEGDGLDLNQHVAQQLAERQIGPLNFHDRMEVEHGGLDREQRFRLGDQLLGSRRIFLPVVAELQCNLGERESAQTEEHAGVEVVNAVPAFEVGGDVVSLRPVVGGVGFRLAAAAAVALVGRLDRPPRVELGGAEDTGKPEEHVGEFGLARIVQTHVRAGDHHDPNADQRHREHGELAESAVDAQLRLGPIDGDLMTPAPYFPAAPVAAYQSESADADQHERGEAFIPGRNREHVMKRG